jgi:hypothetical protein
LITSGLDRDEDGVGKAIGFLDAFLTPELHRLRSATHDVGRSTERIDEHVGAGLEVALESVNIETVIDRIKKQAVDHDGTYWVVNE